MHKRLVANIVSRILLFVCFFMLFPLGWAAYDDLHSKEVVAFKITILLGLFLAAAVRLCIPIHRDDYKKINAKDGLAIVGISWIVLSVFGALPLYYSHVVPSYTDALFEIASGFTTTGATVFSNVEALPRGILFWRSLTHWIGGMGIIVLYIALLPAIGSRTFQIYKAEAPGMTVERVEPRIQETAKNLWGVYFLLSFAECVLLWAGGMSVFDALCHTFGTMATGGFSTKNASVGAFSPYIQCVIMVFMFLAGTNFILHYIALKKKPNPYMRDEEFRWYFYLIIFLIPAFAFVLAWSGISKAPVLDAAFQIVAILTTTGFTTANFDLWPYALQFVLVILMFIGGCGGSTGGGMKFIRHIMAVKIALRSVIQSVLPNAVLPVKYNGKPLGDPTILAVLSYFVIFMILCFVGTVFLTISELTDLVTAFTASVSALSNIGPGLSHVGPAQHFGWISSPGKWMLIFLMLAGRLELYSILILIIPSTWRK